MKTFVYFYINKKSLIYLIMANISDEAKRFNLSHRIGLLESILKDQINENRLNERERKLILECIENKPIPDHLEFDKSSFEVKLPGEYEVYHKTYSSAISEAYHDLEIRGYQMNSTIDIERISEIPRPNIGQTNRFSIGITKDGKLLKQAYHIQIYNTGTVYELNAYVL